MKLSLCWIIFLLVLFSKRNVCTISLVKPSSDVFFNGSFPQEFERVIPFSSFRSNSFIDLTYSGPSWITPSKALPSEVGFLRSSGILEGIFVQGNYTYVAEYYGLKIIDTSNILEPRLVGGVGIFASRVFVLGDYAYTISFYNGFNIISISNKKKPLLVGSLSVDDPLQIVVVNENYAIVTDWNVGVNIINISNKENPKLVSVFETAGLAYGLYVEDRFAFVADYGSGLNIIDIANKTHPFLFGKSSGIKSRLLSVFVKDNFAFLGDKDGLKILNVTDTHTRKKKIAGLSWSMLVKIYLGNLGNKSHVGFRIRLVGWRN